MPRLVASEDFKGGIVYARIQELHGILVELRSPAVLTLAELERIRERIDSIDTAVRYLRRDLCNSEVKQMVTKYEAKCEIVINYLERRERNAGRQVGEGEAQRAARLRDPELDMYSSDGKHTVPMSCYSVVTTTSAFQPVSAQDLRTQLDERRAGKGLRGFDEPSTSDGQRRPHRGDRTPFQAQPARTQTSSEESSSAEPIFGGTRRQRTVAERKQYNGSNASSELPRQRSRYRSPSPMSTMSIRTSTSHASAATGASYRSTHMKCAKGPQTEVSLPPFMTELPHPIQAGDQDLIGTTEIYVQRASNRCPMCNGDHRLIRWADFNGLILVDRWYHALSAGVCLHCLRHGHSSFRCFVDGHCAKCSKPHNSLLCPRNPANSTGTN